MNNEQAGEQKRVSPLSCASLSLPLPAGSFVPAVRDRCRTSCCLPSIIALSTVVLLLWEFLLCLLLLILAGRGATNRRREKARRRTRRKNKDEWWTSRRTRACLTISQC